CYQYYSGFTF
nr:immunoglobulin light chain junction region [Macaca mulatta]MOX23885.1 immunoglobulin light chain junction region [Macaca mulatta]MOX23935.1 immunoglobulin light chain junction region [Macaca mulatta]MOX23987.1 immunoglobulin light chain junction region [Macaca mulatta]MOX24026.1 immunoglobulin light chain junction region [Macaca mulatta]